jgi:uncharacterized membrane protein YgcG
MRTVSLLVGLGALAATVAFGVARIEAQQSTLMDFCPAQHSSTDCSTAAAMFVSLGKFTDDQIITYVSAIADAARSSSAARGCKDTAAGLAILAGAIKNEATRSLVQQVADSLCASRHGFGTQLSSVEVQPWPAGADTGTPNHQDKPAPVTTSPPVDSSSGSSGQTSSGASGNTSSGASGNTSSGASGNTSSGASGGTSGLGVVTSN